MSASVFVFNRLLSDEPEHYYAQTVTVFAPDQRTAKQVLDRDLQRMRDGAADDEPALRDQPSWDVHSVELDEPKVITFAVT